MSKFTILLGGDITHTDRMQSQVTNTRIIAADGGIAHAHVLNIEPELWVGDFDSTHPELASKYGHIARKEFDINKDLTDGEIAIRMAQEMGATSMTVVGAFGGRTAQAVNHLLMAASSEQAMLLTSGMEEGVPLNAPVRPDWPAGTVFSIIAFEQLCGLTIQNAKWPLDNVTVEPGSGLGISNVALDRVEISCRSGRAIAIAELPVTA